MKHEVFTCLHVCTWTQDFKVAGKTKRNLSSKIFSILSVRISVRLFWFHILCHCGFHSVDLQLLGCFLVTLKPNLESVFWLFSSLFLTCDIVWSPPSRQRLSSVAGWGCPAVWTVHLWSFSLLYTLLCYAAPVQSHEQLCVDISVFHSHTAPLKEGKEKEDDVINRQTHGRWNCVFKTCHFKCVQLKVILPRVKFGGWKWMQRRPVRIGTVFPSGPSKPRAAIS